MTAISAPLPWPPGALETLAAAGAAGSGSYPSSGGRSWRRPAVRCRARSSRTGEPCKNYAVHGATVCRSHGGAAPQVRAAAERRLAEAALVAASARADARAWAMAGRLWAREVRHRQRKIREAARVLGVPEEEAGAWCVSAASFLAAWEQRQQQRETDRLLGRLEAQYPPAVTPRE